MGILSESEGPKIVKNGPIYDFGYICTLVVLIYGDFWENISPCIYFVGSMWGFGVGQRVRKL